MVMIRQWVATGFAGILAISMGSAVQSQPKTEARWTIEDIVTAPEVTDIALNGTATRAAYVVKTADIGRDRPIATLNVINLHDGQKKVLLRDRIISGLRMVPGTNDWSVLADLGAGQQLYRIGADFSIRVELAHRPLARVGVSDGSTNFGSLDMPLDVGILSYAWSPDGKWLWYSSIRPRISRAVLFDTEVAHQLGVRRPQKSADIIYHLRSIDGVANEVAVRPPTDRIAQFFGGTVAWTGEEVQFSIEDRPSDGPIRYERRGVRLSDRLVRVLADWPASPFARLPPGPHGGRLTTLGIGHARKLVEVSETRTLRDYGKVDFLIDDPRSAGSWRSRDGNATILGTRYLEHPRYGLVLINKNQAHAISSNLSLTKCDFTPDLKRGVCIRESLSHAPEIVSVRPDEAKIDFIAAVSDHHSAISELQTTPATWNSRGGYPASGFVVWPRHYRPGIRYPAVIVTHGSDADERFCRDGFQWNYPVQFFAEQGYFVLLVNDPTPSQSARLSAAYARWGSGTGDLPAAEVQQLIWLEGVGAFEAAITQMIEQGLVDPDRVGIAGYSRGSQMANVTMTQSTMFRAASSGDGGYLEPSAYPRLMKSYDAIFGGSPFGPAIENYRRLSPSLRADKASGPVLFQMATPQGGAIDFYRALRAANIPAQIDLYPGRDSSSDEAHIFTIPSNRMLAMRENIVWFDFWLKGKAPAQQPFPDRGAIWSEMATSSPLRPAEINGSTP